MATTSVTPNTRLRTPTLAVFVVFVPTGIVNVLLGPLLPQLSARWALNDAQAGRLFTAQFLASTVGVVCSGVLVPRFGYRATLVVGVILMALGVFVLPMGSWGLAMVSVACYGAGFGITIPTANLLIADANPTGKASALNLLNFAWSVGAVACPLLVGHFLRTGQTSTFLSILAASILLVGFLLAVAPLPPPSPIPAPASTVRYLATLLRTSAAVSLGVLFFVYVGTENAVGGWLASYAKRIVQSSSSDWVSTPSYFYAALLAGRLFVPILLRRISEVRMARVGIAAALIGVVALMASASMISVCLSASLIGLGLAAIYPITIALLSHSFGPAANSLASVMFALAGFGAACVPWMVGYVSTRLSSLELGLAVPLLGCGIMLALYFRNWPTEAEPQRQ